MSQKTRKYYPLLNTDKEFNLAETGFGIYKDLRMLKLHCTATGAEEKEYILNEFNITPEIDPAEFELLFDDVILTKTVNEFNAEESGDIKVLIRKVIENNALLPKVAERYSLEDYLLESFRLLFIEAGEFENVKAEDLNMREMRIAEHDFFLMASGRSENLLIRSVT